jgi:hypothetical protein
MKSQRGFAAVEALLISVVVAIIGGTSYYVWRANQKSSDTYSAANKSALSSPAKKKTVKAASSEFSIKELGVKFALPISLKGLSYDVKEISDDQGKPTKAIYLSNSSFADLGDKCENAAGDYPVVTTVNFAALTRVEGKYNSAEEAGEASLIKQFPTFHILYSVPNGAICGADEENVKTAFFAAMHKSQSAFYDSFKATAVETK